LVLVVLIALIYCHKGPHPQTYKMSEPWTHPPILWASDEPVGHHGHGGHGEHPLTIGGGASGKW
jgi:hypothetical protein